MIKRINNSAFVSASELNPIYKALQNKRKVLGITVNFKSQRHNKKGTMELTVLLTLLVRISVNMKVKTKVINRDVYLRSILSLIGIRSTENSPTTW